MEKSTIDTNEVGVVDNSENKPKKKFFDIKGKYEVALLAGLVAAFLSLFMGDFFLLISAVAVVLYAIYWEVKVEQSKSKMILGIIVSPIISLLIFSLGGQVIKSIML